MDFRKNPPPLQPLIIKGTEVERTRLLGLQITLELSWTLNYAATFKRAHTVLYSIAEKERDRDIIHT